MPRFGTAARAYFSLIAHKGRRGLHSFAFHHNCSGQLTTIVVESRSAMKAPNISESEWSVMEVLWKEHPQTASSIAKALLESTGWAENTVRTLLTRLLDKGALEIANPSDSPKRYRPAVERETCVKAESESFLERIFQGAAKPLLVHFARNSRLTPEEIRELKILLDEAVERNP